MLTRREIRSLRRQGPPGGRRDDQRERGRTIEQLASSLAQTYPDTNRNRDLLVKTEFEAYRDVPGGGDTNIAVMLMVLALLVLLDRLRERRRTSDESSAGEGSRGCVAACRRRGTRAGRAAAHDRKPSDGWGGGGILGVLFGYLVISCVSHRSSIRPTSR